MPGMTTPRGRWVPVDDPHWPGRADWVPTEQPASPDGRPGEWHVVSGAPGAASRWEWHPASRPVPPPPPVPPGWGAPPPAQQGWSQPAADQGFAPAPARAPKRWPWVLAAGVAAIVVISVATSSGSGGSGTPVTVADQAKSTPKAKAAPKPAAAAAASGPSTVLPMQDGDWRLDSLTVSKEDYSGDFTGRARITYTGGDSHGGNNLFTITVFVGGRDVGTLQGSATDVASGQTKTTDLISTDKFVAGSQTYTFQNDL